MYDQLTAEIEQVFKTFGKGSKVNPVKKGITELNREVKATK
jgi:hypothetical protein